MKNELFVDNYFSRIVDTDQNYEIIRDSFRGRGVEICYVKFLPSTQNGKDAFTLSETFKADQITENEVIGLLLHGTEHGKGYTVWIPEPPRSYTFDRFQRVKHAENNPIEFEWNYDSNIKLLLTKCANQEGAIYFPFVKIVDPHLSYYKELASLSEQERKLYRRSEWFYASSITSVWNYLIHGRLYDPRLSKTNGSRFTCQQCAYTWWKYLHLHHTATGKNIYKILRDEVAYCILLDMGSDGGWRHGFWSDDMETHVRFHLDGLELFIAQYDLTSDNRWSEACRKGMSFIFNNLTDQLDDGSIWFLHDSIEYKKRHYFPSEIFGKNPYNSLCLNTHLHSLRVLREMQKRKIGDSQTIEKYQLGLRALKRVLDYQPAGVVYNPLIRMVFNEKINSDAASFSHKIRRALWRRTVPPLYWYMQRKYPRLVHPNGFIERDLSISFASDRYHITNMKELLKLYELDRSDWLKPYIVNGLSFLKKYIAKKRIDNAIKGSPYFIETIDILVLYSRLIEEIPLSYIDSIRDQIYDETGAYSVES